MEYLNDLELQGLTLTNYQPNRPIRPIPLIAARGVEQIIAPVNRVPYIDVPEVASVDKLIRELTIVKGIVDSPETSLDTAQQKIKEFDKKYMYIFKYIDKRPRYFDYPDVISQLRALEISIQNKSPPQLTSELINNYKQIFDNRGGGNRRRNSIGLHLRSNRRKNKIHKSRRSRRSRKSRKGRKSRRMV